MSSNSVDGSVTSESTSHSESISPSKIKGFFGLMKKSVSLRNRKTHKGGTPSSEESPLTQGGVIQIKRPVSRPRRFLKATPPPEIPPQEQAVVKLPPTSDDDVSEQEMHSHFPVSKLPMVQDEAQRELTEKWRKDRLDATAAIRKEHKEKEIMDHRLNRGQHGGVVDPSSTATVVHDNGPIPAILSVASQFPEHKRTVQEASLPLEEEPLVKKSKREGVAVDEDIPGRSVTTKENAANIASKASLPRWAKVAVPAAVVALAAILTIKMLRGGR